MHHRRSTVSFVAVLVLAITIGALLMRRSPVAGAAEEQRFQPFQFYAERDVITYGDARIDLEVPRNRVAVLEWISFHARNVQCTLRGVMLQTTLKEQNALHTVVGVTDLGPSGPGRSFGLSRKIRAYSGPGTTVSVLIFFEPTPTGLCAGDGLDLTVAGHYERP
jgi:hypothetical protein